MPLSKKQPTESKDEFIQRCMKEMESEFPDRKQRYAVCLLQSRKRG